MIPPVVEVVLREDGAHFRWMKTQWATNHEIILKLDGEKLTERSVSRLQAFAAVIVENGTRDMKKAQKDWEAKLERGASISDEALAIVPICYDALKLEFAKRLQLSINFALRGLEGGVEKALQHFSPEEIEKIVREVIANSVLKA